MAKLIQDVTSDFVGRSPQWERCRDAFEGSDQVKARGRAYLPQMEAHSEGEYREYVLRAHFLPATERTVTMFTGMAFRKELQTKTPARMAKELAEHLDDVTLEGEDIAQISSDALRETVLVGRYGILLDWSKGLERPYWKVYKSEDIRRIEKLRRWDGVMALSEVVLREWIEDGRIKGRSTEYLYQHYLEVIKPAAPDGMPTYVYRLQIWREAATKAGTPIANPEKRFERHGEVVTQLRLGVALDRIPFVPVVSSGNGRKCPKPPMLDLVDTNMSHYRTSADRENGAYWTARPTPWVTGHTSNERMVVGGNVAWMIPSPDAKVGMLEFTGNGLRSLKELMDEKRADMAMLGAKMLAGEKKAAETAEAMRLRAAESSASLADIVVMTSKALTMALWLHVWWFYGDAEPKDTDVDVSISTDFVDATIEPQMLTALVAAVQGGKMTYETFYYNLEKAEMTRPGVTAEEEQEQARQEFEDDNPEPTLDEAARAARAAQGLDPKAPLPKEPPTKGPPK